MSTNKTTEPTPLEWTSADLGSRVSETKFGRYYIYNNGRRWTFEFKSKAGQEFDYFSNDHSERSVIESANLHHRIMSQNQSDKTN